MRVPEIGRVLGALKLLAETGIHQFRGGLAVLIAPQTVRVLALCLLDRILGLVAGRRWKRNDKAVVTGSWV